MSNQLLHKMVVATGIVAAVFCSAALGQQKQPINISGEGVKSRWVQQHIIDVDDVPGHQIRNYEIQRTYPAESQPVVDGEHVVEVWTRGFSNYTNGIGPAWSYTTWTTEKGNKIFIESIGTSETRATETGSKRGTYQGTSRLISGTGRFAKLRGLLVDMAKFDTDPKGGYNVLESHGEYWFEQ